MTDIFDQAQQRDAEQLEHAMHAQKQRAAKTPKLEPIGVCHNPKCGDDIAPRKNFSVTTIAHLNMRAFQG